VNLALMLAIYDDQQVVRNIPNHNFVDIFKMKLVSFFNLFENNKFQLTLYHQILQRHLQMQYQVDKQDMPYAKQYDMILEYMY